MIYVDAHCDTITKIIETGESLKKNECHVDLERMMHCGAKRIQFFAAFIDPAVGNAYAMKRAMQIIDRLYQEIEHNKALVMLCNNYAEINEALYHNKIAAVLSIEGGEALQGDLSALRMFYKLGVRSIGLTWNHRNEIADGVGDEESGGGLTGFGRSLINEMNELGMLIDLSHITEKGFWDVMEITKSPLIVSHSNAKKICNHKRNLTDRQIEAVKKNNGVIGINLYPYFLNNTDRAGLQDVIKHVEHITGVSGEDHIGIGADFDGIECTPEEINGVQDMEKIFNELLKLNYSEDSVKKIAGNNFLRVIREVFQ